MLADDDEREEVARLNREISGPPPMDHSVLDSLNIPPWARDAIAAVLFLVAMLVYWKLR
jgi:hypothetical protein